MADVFDDYVMVIVGSEKNESKTIIGTSEQSLMEEKFFDGVLNSNTEI